MYLEDYISLEEKKAYLEGMAQGIFETINSFGLYDGNFKSYDPLTIEMHIGCKELIAHSYVFEFNDGGRHHYIKSLKELYSLLINEIERYKPIKESD